ncbi:hypothetical protein AB0K51_26215 [Kitasatospora sp. NPDC049285]|uniref:hypothetical protein n=1 Tax=Kitasatospora sp. NPDC049285 TaxID=3157096 RepID=UPI0034493133
MNRDEREDEVRLLLRDWLEAPRPAADAQLDVPALDVPPGDAATLIGAVRDLLGPTARHAAPRELSTLADRRFTELRLLAESLVLDEHPSVGSWSLPDRYQAGCWLAVLIERRGDAGVEHLLDVLRRSAARR